MVKTSTSPARISHNGLKRQRPQTSRPCQKFKEDYKHLKVVSKNINKAREELQQEKDKRDFFLFEKFKFMVPKNKQKVNKAEEIQKSLEESKKENIATNLHMMDYDHKVSRDVVKPKLMTKPLLSSRDSSLKDKLKFCDPSAKRNTCKNTPIIQSPLNAKEGHAKAFRKGFRKSELVKESLIGSSKNPPRKKPKNKMIQLNSDLSEQCDMDFYGCSDNANCSLSKAEQEEYEPFNGTMKLKITLKSKVIEM
ncbi:unnamed protein product [Moneuplotes crassus]|uniref:Uncharacterized protein n=1 Tax=Euplotes crassus TaxID=5936 RepID=A0AAD1U116_EUPCR|nr:unnamed protein product [Moneuplotes crassus]